MDLFARADCRCNTRRSAFSVTALVIWAVASPIFAQQGGVEQEFDDHRNMMEQLGIKRLRPGANPNDETATYDVAGANRYSESMPSLLVMNDGTPVTSPEQWPARRAELVELFEREIYGRIPANAPAVSWEVVETTEGQAAGVPVVTRKLVGHVDNSGHPAVNVDIEATITTPKASDAPRPIMLEFGFGAAFAQRFARRAPAGPRWTDHAVMNGWAYGTIVPVSIQPDNNDFRAGVIGIANKGQPRKPDDWGALRAWGWGVSRLIDYFEAHPELPIDPTKVGIEGVSRYGKAALVTQAFDPRVAVAFVASSGEGGAKLHRRTFGERVENLTGRGGYHWMAGNFLKYGAADAEFGEKTVADLPVDAHELIALCAPRPCFISNGIPERGDPHWIDARGAFMAGVLAGPAYRLLGKQDFGAEEDYLTAAMPAVNELIGGELAWRQHDGGHEATPNWPTFFEWIARYVPAPPAPAGAKLPDASSDPPAAPLPGGGAGSGRDAGAPHADQAVERGDANSKLAHEQLVEKAKQGGIDLYFLGDSITRRWGTSDPKYADLLANWRKNFHGWNAGNFGWGGDTTQNILWRITHGELDGVDPKVIVILAGTNNLGNQPGDDGKVADIAAGVAKIVSECRQRAPRAKLILTAIFPRNDNTAVMPTIDAINERLAKLAARDQVQFLNVNDTLADAEGRLLEGMTHDGLHPTVAGYQVWADGLKPLLTEILGPPGAADHAPQPTGDPSAAQ